MLLYIETEKNDIAVLDNIVLALKTYKPLFLGCSIGAAVEKILIIDNLCADKAALKVAVNLAGCLRSLGSFGYCPGSCLRRTCSEIADKTEERVACSDELIKT